MTKSKKKNIMLAALVGGMLAANAQANPQTAGMRAKDGNQNGCKGGCKGKAHMRMQHGKDGKGENENGCKTKTNVRMQNIHGRSGNDNNGCKAGCSKGKLQGRGMQHRQLNQSMKQGVQNHQMQGAEAVRNTQSH